MSNNKCVTAALFVIAVNYKTSLTLLHNFKYNRNSVTCYNVPDPIVTLKVDNKLKTSDKSIFFLETSCKGGLDPRQACAVESASRANPDWEIFILQPGPLDITNQSIGQSKATSVLSKLHNVVYARINVTEFTKNSQIERLYSENRFQDSVHPVVHNSDVLRLLVLNKYGGMYLDLDVVVVKSFNGLPTDFIAKEGSNHISNGILRFSKKGIGHKFTELALAELNKNFFPQLWSANGPELVRRVLRKICSKTKVPQWKPATCEGMDFFDEQYFYPIPYTAWHRYYTRGGAAELPKFSSAYAHHVWYSLGAGAMIKRTSLYAKLASMHCPETYYIYGDNFFNSVPQF